MGAWSTAARKLASFGNPKCTQQSQRGNVNPCVDQGHTCWESLARLTEVSATPPPQGLGGEMGGGGSVAVISC